MKKILLTSALLASIATFNLYAATAFQVIAYDRNGNQQVNAQEVQSGQDYFLARPATQTEIAQHALGLFTDNKENTAYVPVKLQDLQSYDTDKNGVITANEADQTGVKIVQHIDNQFIVNSLDDNGLSVIRFEQDTNGVKIVLVPTAGQTPIKTFIVQLDHY